MRKELSGLFLSPERFQASLQVVAAEKLWDHIRLFHAEPHHLVQLLQALTSTTVHHLDIHELADGEGNAALQVYLQNPTVTSPRVLSIHTIKGLKAASDLGVGLASPACQVEELNLCGLENAELAALLLPLTHQHGKLVKLSLSRCSLGPASGACLPALHQLTHLHLTDCVLSDALAGEVLQPHSTGPAVMLDDQGTCQLLAPVPAYTSLTSLRVCGSNLSTQAGAAISSLLALPTCQLTELLLNNSAALDKAIPQLAAGLASNTSLHKLELDYCNIGPASAAALAHTLSIHPGLTHLSLNYNQIGAAGLHALLQAVSAPSGSSSGKHSALAVLKAEGNWIKGAEMPAWPDGWTVVSPLQQLHLGKNHLSDVGAHLLEVVLSSTGALTHLDLTSNGIGSTGAASLVSLLRAHPGMRDLRLDQNRLHDAGAELLVDAVQAHPSLRVFRADACRVVDMRLKARVSQLTEQLAARQSQSAAAAAGTAAGGAAAGQGMDEDRLAPLPKIGKRFAPEVYMVGHQQQQQGDQGDTVMTDAATGEDAPTAPRRVRQGSRFPPEVYSVQLSGDAPAVGGGVGGGGGGLGQMLSGGKHVLGVGEREADPRAGKMLEGAGGMNPFRDHAWHDDVSNRMTTAGPVGCTAMDQDVPSRGNAGGGGGGGDVRHTGTGRGASRYSLDVPCSYSLHPGDLSTASSATLSISPPHHPMMRCTMSLDLDAASSRAHNSRSAPGGLPHQQIVSYMTVRPSMQKKRSYKPLTPQQQAMFDIF